MGGYLFHQQQDEQYSRLMSGTKKRLNGCITISDYFPVFSAEELAGKDFFEVGQKWIEDFYAEYEDQPAPKYNVLHLREICYTENGISMEQVFAAREKIENQKKRSNTMANTERKSVVNGQEGIFVIEEAHSGTSEVEILMAFDALEDYATSDRQFKLPERSLIRFSDVNYKIKAAFFEIGDDGYLTGDSYFEVTVFDSTAEEE